VEKISPAHRTDLAITEQPHCRYVAEFVNYNRRIMVDYIEHTRATTITTE